jgi:hypothetical protein
LNFYQAESYCITLGGRLASVQSKDGLDKIATGQFLSVKSNGYWIGLNILNKTAGYQWTDSSPVSFTNWNSGQPDNLNGLEECTETRSNQMWNDINCYLNRGWICKISKGVVPTSNTIVIADTYPGKSNFSRFYFNFKIFQIKSNTM